MSLLDGFGCQKCGGKPLAEFSMLCEQHYAERRARLSPIALRGAVTRRERYPERHMPLAADKFWQRYAMQMVSAAKSRGILPALDGTIACNDCGQPATKYEHRDYARPLDVEPVCGSCNAKRGTASWPTADMFVFKKVAAMRARGVP